MHIRLGKILGRGHGVMCPQYFQSVRVKGWSECERESFFAVGLPWKTSVVPGKTNLLKFYKLQLTWSCSMRRG